MLWQVQERSPGIGPPGLTVCVSLWDSRQLGLRKAQVPGRMALTYIVWRNVPRGEVTWVGV